MHDVFISYSHKDKTVADAICARFESANIRCWYAPRDIAPGADWAASIVEAVSTAKILVLVFTDFSNASTQVLREVNTAVSSGIPVVPFKLTQTEPVEGMQYYLSTSHWLDAIDRPLKKSVDRLFEMVSAMLSGIELTKEQLDAFNAPKKKKKWLIPVIAVSVVLLIGVVVGGYFTLNRFFPDTFKPLFGSQTADLGETVVTSFPLSSDTVRAYVEQTYGHNHDDVKFVIVGETFYGEVYIQFTKDGKEYYYKLRKDDGTEILRIEGLDEIPDELIQSTERPTEISDRAIDACESMVSGRCDNIKIRHSNEDPALIYVSFSCDGVEYEFVYNKETDEATQISP